MSLSQCCREFHSQNYRIPVIFSNLLNFVFILMSCITFAQWILNIMRLSWAQKTTGFLFVCNETTICALKFVQKCSPLSIFQNIRKWDMQRKPPLVTHQPILYHCTFLIWDEFPELLKFDSTVCLLKRAKVIRYSTFCLFFSVKSTPPFSNWIFFEKSNMIHILWQRFFLKKDEDM